MRRATTLVTEPQPVPKAGPASFEAEVLPWLSAVRQYALRLTGNAPDADDLVQLTFLNAWRGWHTFRPGSDPRRWLFAIARNAYLRGRQREQKVTAVEDPELETLAAAVAVKGEQGDMALRTLEHLDLPEAITQAMATLNPLYREAVLLVDVEGRDYEDAAAEAGVPVGTIRSRLYRGRRLLQEQLLDHARDLGFQTAKDHA
jgi:RNA polymerase sigma-70 factor (ECF subfamily)